MNETENLWNKIIWIRGIPPIDFWIKREDIIGRFIDKNKIKPFNTDPYAIELSGGAAAAPAAAKKEKVLLVRRPPFPGGIKCPHLHFKGDVFILNADQWQFFTNDIKIELIDKLKGAKTVSFEQVREISEAIDRIG